MRFRVSVTTVWALSVLVLSWTTLASADPIKKRTSWPPNHTIALTPKVACGIAPARAYVKLRKKRLLVVSKRLLKKSRRKRGDIPSEIRSIIFRFKKTISLCLVQDPPTQLLPNPGPTAPPGLAATQLPTATPTRQPTVGPQGTAVPTFPATATATPSYEPTQAPPTLTPTAMNTALSTATPLATVTSTATPRLTPTRTSTATASPSPTRTPTFTPTQTATATATSSPTPRSPSQLKVMLFHPFQSSPNTRTGVPETFIGYENAALPVGEGLPIPEASNLPQPLRLNYIIATETTEDDIAGPAHIRVSDLDHDEFAFQHAANPAAFNLQRSSSGFNLFWRYDQRSHPLSAYRVSRLVLSSTPPALASSFEPARGRRYWWEEMTWGVVATVSADSPDGFFEYQDALPNGNALDSRVACYLIESVLQNGEVRSFAFPRCGALSPAASAAPVVKSVQAELTSSSCPATNRPHSLALGQLCSTEPLRCSCNNAYTVIVGVSGTLAPQDLELELYQYERPALASGSAGTQRSGVLVRDSTFISPRPVLNNDGNYEFHLTNIERPVIFNRIWDLANPTEQIVFRVRLTVGGAVTTLPTEGGHYVLGTNNRVRDRLWRGFNMIPDRASWIQAMSQKLRQFNRAGYTGVLFDELRPFKGAKFNDWWATDLLEVSPIEYTALYPEMAHSIQQLPSDFNDPWTTHTANMLSALRTALADLPFDLSGNTIKGLPLSTPSAYSRLMKPAEDTIAAQLTYPVFETCLVGWSNGALAPVGIEEWNRHIQRLEQMQSSSSQRMPICLNTASPPNSVQAPWSEYSQLNPTVRLFNYASMLMVRDPSTVILASLQIKPSMLTANYPSTRIDDFIEYQLDLGNPLNERSTVPGADCITRAFENGTVVVNPLNAPRSCVVTLPVAAQLVSISPPPLPRSQVCTSQSCNPGILTVTRGVRTVTVPSGSAAILLDENVSIPSHRAATTSLDLNADRVTDMILQNTTTNAIVGARFGPDSIAASYVSISDGAAPGSVDSPNSLIVGDYNGDGAKDIFVFNATTGFAEVRLLTTGGTLLSQTIISDPASAVRWREQYWEAFGGDFNGDGISDILLYSKANGHAINVTFSPAGRARDYIEISPPNAPRGWRSGYWDLLARDFNGDRRTDLFLINKADGVAVTVLFGTQGTASAYRAFTFPSELVRESNYWDTLPGDFNGDGITDLLLFNKLHGEAHCSLFNALGQPSSFVTISDPNARTHWNANYWDLIPGDFNGDQITDLILYNQARSESISVLFNSLGAPRNYSGNLSQGIDRPALPIALGRGYYVGDYNGDGTDDLLSLRLSDGEAASVLFSAGAPVELHHFSFATSDLGSWLAWRPY